MVDPSRKRISRLERIGLFTRDQTQDYPFETIERLFSRTNIHVYRLPGETPTEPLDLVIALGGDGTVLRALNAFPGVPVLAVNFGHLGFLTACDRSELDSGLVRLLAEDYHVEDRLTLEVRHGDRAYRCVNEVVVKGTSHMITTNIRVNDQHVSRSRGDGVIVGTPTGSTAYLLATGGPILMPVVNGIILKPLNEYSFTSRSVLMPSDARVSLEIASDERSDDILLVADGGAPVRLESGARIEITRSNVPARLVFFEDDSFFRNLRSRLNWSNEST